MKNLSKKNLTLLIICLGLILAVYVFKKDPGDTVNYKAATAQNEEIENTGSGIVEKVAEIDSDNDGLKDWEETLWKTDTKNPDTDGDGTTDGDEVAENRNPKVKGPDDGQKPGLNAILTDDGLSATQKLARQSYVELLEAKNNGKKLTPEETSAIIESIIKGQSNQFEPKVYSSSDILATGGDSSEEIKRFGNELGDIHLRNSPKIIENSIYLLAIALRDKNPEVPSKLALQVTSHEAIIADSLKLVVPKSAATAHLKLINAMSRMGKVTEGFSKIYDDPVTSVVALGEYKIAQEQLRDALAQLKLYFETKKITFTKDEKGYEFVE